ncbi:hypothetical protein HD806DRAFT_213241 [Xylariaceae sp. AK1471]|nr:hypothetical protein HD806DRAFT_213241 [Xylariaceae sp. AK1471]
MSSTEDPSRPFGDEDPPTHNPPWPYIDSFTQGRMERKFLTEGAAIDFDRIPKLQFWAPWFGVTDVFRVMSVLRRVSSHSNSAMRPLTGPEASAISEHAARSVRYFAWAQPVSLGIAIAIAVRGRKTFKFPLYQPKMKKFDPQYFPSKTLSILKGPRAPFTWHIIRVAAYFPFVWIPTAVFFSSIADTSFQAHVLGDSRLTGLVEDVRRNAKNVSNMREQELRRRRGIPNPPETTRPQTPQQTGDSVYRDPTPQDYGSTDYAAQPSSTYDGSGAATETSQSTQRNWPQSTYTQSAPRKMQGKTQAGFGSRPDKDDSDLFDEDDDASPVASSARRAEVGQGSSSGSAWDRLRQQARSGSSQWAKGDSSGQEQGWAQLRQDKTRNPREATPKVDGFSYSKDDEERETRNYERDQAQKEFDALVEAERRGEGGNASSSSWRKRG